MSEQPNPVTEPDTAPYEEPLVDAAHHLPLPSAYPVTLAAGVTLLLTGLLYGILFVVVGLLLMAIAVRGWIGEVYR